jgi:hypothetical protein
VWSALAVAFILMFAIGEGIPNPLALTGWERVLMFFSGLVFAGLIAGWFREAAGACLTLGGFAGFYLANRAMTGSWPRGPFFALLAAPGLFFLAVWLLGRHRVSNATE